MVESEQAMRIPKMWQFYEPPNSIRNEMRIKTEVSLRNLSVS